MFSPVQMHSFLLSARLVSLLNFLRVVVQLHKGALTDPNKIIMYRFLLVAKIVLSKLLYKAWKNWIVNCVALQSSWFATFCKMFVVCDGISLITQTYRLYFLSKSFLFLRNIAVLGHDIRHTAWALRRSLGNLLRMSHCVLPFMSFPRWTEVSSPSGLWRCLSIGS